MHVLDVTDRAAVAALPAAVVERHGRVDGLLNVAGRMHRFADIGDLGLDEAGAVLDLNFWGPVAMTTVSSMAAFVTVPGQSAYSASKAALQLWSETPYMELRGSGIAVTTVFPGTTATPIMANSGALLPGRDLADAGANPILSSPAKVAARIVHGLERGTFHVVVGLDAHAVSGLWRLAPTAFTTLYLAVLRRVLAP